MIILICNKSFHATLLSFEAQTKLLDSFLMSRKMIALYVSTCDNKLTGAL